MHVIRHVPRNINTRLNTNITIPLASMTDTHSTPLAAQLLKKALRLSLAGATRASSGFRTSNSFESTKRRSTLLMTPASNKRTSNLNGSVLPASQSSGGGQNAPMSNSQLSSSYSQSSQRRGDLRPLRDKNYQSLILQEIYDFLTANKFELEMNHPIMLKTLQLPTQKDFVLIFQFLYGRIDPNYKFTRSIETEVFALLKTLNYPYLDGINRSSISAVGGQNWPSFLGMLYWLVKLNLALLNLNEDYFIAPDDVFDRVFIKYIISSYRAFIDQKEDYSDFYEEMKRGFESANSEVLQEVQSKKEAEKLLRQEFELLNRQYREVEEAEAKSKALENDLRQFSEYMVKMKERQSKWGEILQQMETEITNAENQLKALEMEKKTYENSIINKGYTIADIDKLNQERDKLSKSIDAVSNKIEDARENLQRSDSHLRQSFQSLESFVNQYNLMTHKISSDDLFRLTLNSSLIEDDTKGYDYEQVLNRPLREEKIRLLLRRTELNQEVHNIQEECIKIVEQVDQYSEKIFDQQEEIESLEATVAKNKSTQEEIYETMVSEGTSYSAQIEKLDRELQGLQINVNKGIIEAETRHKNLKIAYQEWKYHIKEQREVLHDSVQRLIDYIISFKLNVQENIEELDALTLKELEHEQGLEGSISE